MPDDAEDVINNNLMRGALYAAQAVLRLASKDPSLRYNARGRKLLRALFAQAGGLEECQRLVHDMPPHSRYLIVQIARSCADEWLDFAHVATHFSEIGIRRPFYPQAPGKKGQVALQHLLDGLGLATTDELRRACERASTKLPGILIGMLLTFVLGIGATAEAKILGGQSVIVISHDIEIAFTYAQNWPLGSALAVVVTVFIGALTLALLGRIDLDRILGRR